MRTPWFRGWWLTLALLLAAGCVPGPSDSPAPLPADQRVFLFDAGSNGWTTPYQRELAGPDLVVYGDGRVFRPADSSSPGLPTAYEVARIDPGTVARFARDAEKQDVVTDTTDFGDATVTDQGSATVALHGPSGQVFVTVYAFEERFEDGLTRTQRRNRAELRELIAAAYGLAKDAQRSPYVPERVRVLEFEYAQDGGPPAPEWPGPDLAELLKPTSSPGSALACGDLSGPEAERAYAAARANPDGIWSVAGRTRVLAVVLVLPGVPGCQS